MVLYRERRSTVLISYLSSKPNRRKHRARSSSTGTMTASLLRSASTSGNVSSLKSATHILLPPKPDDQAGRASGRRRGEVYDPSAMGGNRVCWSSRRLSVIDPRTCSQCSACFASSRHCRASLARNAASRLLPSRPCARTLSLYRGNAGSWNSYHPSEGFSLFQSFRSLSQNSDRVLNQLTASESRRKVSIFSIVPSGHSASTDHCWPSLSTI